jgi:hypothetical protein
VLTAVFNTTEFVPRVMRYADYMMYAEARSAADDPLHLLYANIARETGSRPTVVTHEMLLVRLLHLQAEVRRLSSLQNLRSAQICCHMRFGIAQYENYFANASLPEV